MSPRYLSTYTVIFYRLCRYALMLQDIPLNTCIGQYSLGSQDLWAELRSWADRSWDRQRSSVSGQRADLSIKDSWDSTLNSRPDLMKSYQTVLSACLTQYQQDYPFAPGNVVLEYPTMLSVFPPGGGFHRLHCERSVRGSNRVLVYMTYLTSHQGEGWTEFPHWGLKIQPREGLTLIWPTDWPWTHRGITSQQPKYIATGWWVFK